MTDERNPSDDPRFWTEEQWQDAPVLNLPCDGLLDAIGDALERHHVFCSSAVGRVLDALTAAGFVVVRAPGLNHGDELAYGVRRPVPEPATKPCATCGGTGWTRRFSAFDQIHHVSRCACGGSGVATTEGSET